MLANTYDADFTTSAIARGLRARTHARLLKHLQPGMSALELGCGTGEDAYFLGSYGITVTATDASPLMLEHARAKCADLAHVTFMPIDLNDLSNGAVLIPPYDLVFANFGVLNCVRDLPTLAGWLHDQLRPGGVAAFAVMAPFCLFEIAWHAVHTNFATAFRRQRGGTIFQPSPNSAPILLTYPTVHALSHAFAPRFQQRHLEPLGIFLPPSDVYGAIERRPTLLRWLTRKDSATIKIPLLANVADHYWIEFSRL